MNYKFKILFLCLVCLLMVQGKVFSQYEPDRYCEGYLSRTIHQPDDYEGSVVCTIIKKPAMEGVKQAIIYLHGYNDYFFQSPLGDSVNAHGYNFYALDLRKYGRSILPHQDPFFCKNMKREYFQDVDSIITLVRQEGNESIVLMGHSTGGLVCSYYMKYGDRKGEVGALILNSPFLDWNMSPAMEHFALPLVSFLGSFIKRMKVQGTNEKPRSYSQSLLKKFHGEWMYDEDLKKPFGHPVRSGWIHAINRAQKRTHRKRHPIECPILVMSSDQSLEDSGDWNEAFHRADVVLDVADIEKYSQRLGERVIYKQIHGGKHDLILSDKQAREDTYRMVFDWLKSIGM